jgi:hypothetical protein
MLHATDPISPRRWFCPRCGQVSAEAGTLCSDCGERVVSQGYCGVCGDYWRLPVGAGCPKHEIVLAEGPGPAEPPFAPGEVPVWETVARYNLPSAALAPRIRLESEGIPTDLDGERMANHALHHPAVGGVRLRVPKPLADDARIILAQNWSPIAIEGDPDGDDWDEGPEPGRLRRNVMRTAIVLFLTLPVVEALVTWLLT